MIKKLSLVAVAFFAVRLSAFADMREFADYAFLSQYKSIEIGKVGNGTDKDNLKIEVLDKVRNELRQALKRANLPVVMTGDTPDPNKTLLLEPRLTKWSGGFGSAFGAIEDAAGGDNIDGTGVTIFVRFTDKKLETELGTAKVSRGGFSKDGNLTKTSDAIASLIRKKMEDEEGKKAIPVPIGGHYSGSSKTGRVGAMTIEQNSNIAVITLSTKNISGEESEIVTGLLQTEIVNLGVNYYNVLDRQFVDKVMSEHAFAATGLTSSEGAVELGKMLNAHKLVTGTLTKMMDTYFLTANMIDVQTGKIESSASGDYKDSEGMKYAIRDIANKLIHRQ